MSVASFGLYVELRMLAPPLDGKKIFPLYQIWNLAMFSICLWVPLDKYRGKSKIFKYSFKTINWKKTQKTRIHKNQECKKCLSKQKALQYTGWHGRSKERFYSPLSESTNMQSPQTVTLEKSLTSNQQTPSIIGCPKNAGWIHLLPSNPPHSGQAWRKTDVAVRPLGSRISAMEGEDSKQFHKLITWYGKSIAVYLYNNDGWICPSKMEMNLSDGKDRTYYTMLAVTTYSWYIVSLNRKIPDYIWKHLWPLNTRIDEYTYCLNTFAFLLATEIARHERAMNKIPGQTCI